MVGPTSAVTAVGLGLQPPRQHAPRGMNSKAPKQVGEQDTSKVLKLSCKRDRWYSTYTPKVLKLSCKRGLVSALPRGRLLR